MKGYRTMYDYRGKIAGAVGAGVFAVFTFIQKLTHFKLFPKFNDHQHYYLGVVMTVFCLFIMAYSKERNDDERVKLVRARTLQIAYFLFSGLLLSLTFTGILSDDFVLTGPMLLFLCAFNVIFYLIMFHIGIYFDEVWQYGEEPGFLENFKKNWGYILVLTASMLLLIMSIFSLFFSEFA